MINFRKLFRLGLGNVKAHRLRQGGEELHVTSLLKAKAALEKLLRLLPECRVEVPEVLKDLVQRFLRQIHIAALIFLPLQKAGDAGKHIQVGGHPQILLARRIIANDDGQALILVVLSLEPDPVIDRSSFRDW
jgi:hypothetical protein